MAHMARENTKKIVHTGTASRALRPFEQYIDYVLEVSVSRGLSFRGLLFSKSDRGQRDTKQVVWNLMRLHRITSGSICFREFRATLTIWNCFKLGCRASVQQRKQNSIIISWYYSKKKIRLAENRKPRKEQWHLKRCVINRTYKSHEMHVAYKVPKITVLTSSIFTSSKREIDRVALQTLRLRSQIGLWL